MSECSKTQDLNAHKIKNTCQGSTSNCIKSRDGEEWAVTNFDRKIKVLNAILLLF